MSENHPLFSDWPMLELRPDSFDSQVLTESPALICVFFWGRNCPNCEVAKRVLHERIDEFRAFPIRWFQVNTYHHMELGTRFGLHGIPTFMFFQRGKVKGRATSFPGAERFKEILQKLVEPKA